MADYATLAEVKARIDKTSTDDDSYISTIITAASRAIDRICNRPDGFVALTSATARTYSGSGRPTMSIDECVEITLVEVKASISSSTYTSWAASDWIAFGGDKRFPDFNSLPYNQIMTNISGDYSIFTSGRIYSRSALDDAFPIHNSMIFYNPRNDRAVPTVRVTAKWGYAVTVPPTVKEAACMQTARWYKRYQSAMSDTLATGEFGTLLYRQEIDPDIAIALTRFTRPAIGIGR